MTAKAPELLVFGGAFDPPHAAHRAAAAAALREFPDAALVLVPGAAPATAGGGAKTPVASFQDRLAMCRLVSESLGPRASVSDIEARLPTPNYTVTTLKALTAQRPGVRLGLLLGQDQVSTFLQWREPHTILNLATLVILPRRDATPGPPTTSLQHDLSHLFKALPAATDSVHVLAGLDAGPAASHVIRQCLAKGHHASTDWLPTAVATYIHQHSLYGTRTSI